MKRWLCLAILLTPATLFAGELFQDGPSSERAHQVPRLLRYTGWVRSASVPGSAVAVTFSIYTQPEGSAPLWQVTRNVQLDENGKYSVLLGSVNTLPAEIFTANEARWLGVQVLMEAEQARVMLVSVPYALKAHDAETLGGLPPSAFLRADAAAADPLNLTANFAGHTATAGASAPASPNGCPSGRYAVSIDTNGILTCSIAGSNTQVLFNDAGGAAGDPGFAFNKATDTLTTAGGFNTGGMLLSPYKAKPHKWLTVPHSGADEYLGPALNFSGVIYCYPNTRGGSVSANCPVAFGQNINGNGTQENPSIGSVYWSWEPYYEISAGRFAQEAHLTFLSPSGFSHRSITAFSDSAGTSNIGFVNDYAYFANESGINQVYIGKNDQFDWYMGIAIPDNGWVPLLRVDNNAALSSRNTLRYKKSALLANSYWDFGTGDLTISDAGNIGINTIPVADVRLRINAGADDLLDLVGAVPPPNFYFRARGSAVTFFEITKTGAVNAANASSLTVPIAAGAAPVTNGAIAYDAASQRFVGGVNGATRAFAMADSNLAVTNSDNHFTASQTIGGDVALTAPSSGVILRATDGENCFRVTVDNAGALSTTAVSCP